MTGLIVSPLGRCVTLGRLGARRPWRRLLFGGSSRRTGFCSSWRGFSTGRRRTRTTTRWPSHGGTSRCGCRGPRRGRCRSGPDRSRRRIRPGRSHYWKVGSIDQRRRSEQGQNESCRYFPSWRPHEFAGIGNHNCFSLPRSAFWCAHESICAICRKKCQFPELFGWLET